MKKSIPTIRKLEGNEKKNIPTIREQESEAIIPGNGQEEDWRVRVAYDCCL